MGALEAAIVLFSQYKRDSEEKTIAKLTRLAQGRGLDLYKAPEGHCLSFRQQMDFKMDEFSEGLKGYQRKQISICGFKIGSLCEPFRQAYGKSYKELKESYWKLRGQVNNFAAVEKGEWPPGFSNFIDNHFVIWDDFESVLDTSDKTLGGSGEIFSKSEIRIDSQPKGKRPSNSDFDIFPNIDPGEDDLLNTSTDSIADKYTAETVESTIASLEESIPTEDPIKSGCLIDRIVAEVEEECRSANLNLINHKAEDFKALGHHFGRLLLRDKFSCFEVPDLSLLIFQLFYHRVLPLSAVRPFFRGLFAYLTWPSKGDREDDAYIQCAFHSFFGLNMYAFLGVENSLVEALIQLMVDSVGEIEVVKYLEKNFVETYELVLSTVFIFQEFQETAVKRLVKGLLKFESHALKTIGEKGTVFALGYVMGLVKGFLNLPITQLGDMLKVTCGALGEYFEIPLGKLGSIFVEKGAAGVEEMLKKTISLYLPKDNSHQEKAEDLSEMIKERTPVFDTELLQNFEEHFQKKIQTCTSCTMCKVQKVVSLQSFKSLGSLKQMDSLESLSSLKKIDSISNLVAKNPQAKRTSLAIRLGEDFKI